MPEESQHLNLLLLCIAVRSMSERTTLEDIPTQILVLRHLGQPLLDVLGGDLDLPHVHVGGFEREVFEEALKYGVEPASADILSGLVDVEGEGSQGVDRFVGKFERDAFGLKQSGILPRERVFRLFENAN